MYVVREITGMSMEDIGREFGGRDHSTVVYSISGHGKRYPETDTRLRETVEDIIKNVRDLTRKIRADVSDKFST